VPKNLGTPKQNILQKINSSNQQNEQAKEPSISLSISNPKKMFPEIEKAPGKTRGFLLLLLLYNRITLRN